MNAEMPSKTFPKTHQEVPETPPKKPPKCIGKSLKGFKQALQSPRDKLQLKGVGGMAHVSP